MPMFNELVNENDPVNKQHHSLFLWKGFTASRPSHSTRRQKPSPQNP